MNKQIGEYDTTHPICLFLYNVGYFMNIQDTRLIYRMRELLPIREAIPMEREQIDTIPYERLITFITNRPIIKEIAFYYLFKNKKIDFVSVFTADDIIHIYFGTHPDYKNFQSITSPITVLILGLEMYNKELVTILNMFTEQYIRKNETSTLIYAYQGNSISYNHKYKNTSDRGVLNSGSVVILNSSDNVSNKSAIKGNSYDINHFNNM